MLVFNNINSEYDFKDYIRVISKNYNGEEEWIKYLNNTESFTNGEFARYWYSTKNTFLNFL